MYRAVDSDGNTRLLFALVPNALAVAAKRFFCKTLKAIPTQTPRVITVDNNADEPKAIDERKSGQRVAPKSGILTEKVYL